MTLLPVLIFSACILVCLGCVVLLGYFLSPKSTNSKAQWVPVPTSVPLKQNNSIRFYLMTIIFLFWATWLLFFLLPWIFCYQKNGLTKENVTSLLFISAFFLVGFIFTTLSLKKREET